MTHGIKAQSLTTLVHLSRVILHKVKQTRGKPLSNITHGILPHCWTTLGMIDKGKVKEKGIITHGIWCIQIKMHPQTSI